MTMRFFLAFMLMNVSLKGFFSSQSIPSHRGLAGPWLWTVVAKLKGEASRRSSSSLSGLPFWQTTACQREKNEETCQVLGSLQFFWLLPSAETQKKQRGRYRAKITRSIPSNEVLLQSVFVSLCLKEAAVPGSGPGQL